MTRFLAHLGLLTVCVMGILILLVYGQGNRNASSERSMGSERRIMRPLDWSNLNRDIQNAVQTAHATALGGARKQLDTWHAETMHKVDSNFLDWYFGYWNQQRLGFDYLVNAGTNWVKSFFMDVADDSAEQALIVEISREFEQRVIPGPLLQQQFETIARETVATFVQDLRTHLDAVPERYHLSQAEWDQHLANITVMVYGAQGTRSYPVSLKALTAGAIIGGTGVAAPLLKVMGPTIQATIAKAAGAVGAKSAAAAVSKGATAKAAAAGAARVGAGKAAAAGSSLISGPVAIFVISGLIVWEAWDHSSTVAENRPLLRGHIHDYLLEYTNGLLAEDGIIGTILYDLSGQIQKSVAAET